MSDFDREAEREKLREKFERDEEKREAAEEMSELLLQGATMTNQHCPECHSPIFRYDGQQFCPSCRREVTEDGEFADGDDGRSAGAATNGEATDPAGATRSEAESRTVEGRDTAPASGDAGGTASHREADDTRGEREAPTSDSAREQPTETGTGGSRSGEPETRPTPARERSPARIDPPARREAPPNEGRARAEGARDRGRTGADDLREAEAALIREIAALARQAEGTRDVGRKRDLFAAASEAAETLQTIRRT